MSRRGWLSIAVGLAAAVAVAAVVAFVVLPGGGPVLDNASAVRSAMPSAKDMHNWEPSGGIIGALPEPAGQRTPAVLTGHDLRERCGFLAEKSAGWACDGLRGLGLCGFEFDPNVDVRVGCTVLAYDSDDAAKSAWAKVASADWRRLRALHWQPDASLPAAGDQSRSFSSNAGSLVVIRSGSVVAEAISSSDLGPFDTGPGADPAHRDPIRMWSSQLARTITAALSR